MNLENHRNKITLERQETLKSMGHYRGISYLKRQIPSFQKSAKFKGREQILWNPLLERI